MDETLSAAFQYHQRGLLDEAARLYERILAGDPRHPDAQHLLGVVALQQGKAAVAAERISRAIALNGRAAAYHANLAEAYRMLGQYETAASCCRKALALEPRFAGAANNLGLCLQSLGQTDAAIAQFRETLRLQPDFAMAHNNLGIALRSQGKNSEAIVHFQQAIRFAPSLAEAHSNLGQLLFEQNQLEEALWHCREAVRHRPNFPEAHTNLGIVLRGLGRRTEAKASYAEALRQNPGLAVACNNMGQVVQEEGDVDGSGAWYRRSLDLDPDSVLVHCNLAGVLKEQGKLTEALEHYETALRLDPASADAHNGRGWVMHEQGRFEEALEEFRRALELRPRFAMAYCNRGAVLEELGDIEGGLRCFRMAIEQDPGHAEAYALLATALGPALPDHELGVMRTLVTDPNLGNYQRSALHFGIGQVLDGQGDHAGALDHFRLANGFCKADWENRGRGYDPASHAEQIAELIARYTPAFFEQTRGLGHETERPVFIVGFPRSGTTLTEQILASHSQVFGAGELALVRDTFESLPCVMNQAGSAFECLSRLDRETTRQLAERHLEQLAALDGQARRVVDKMPENYLYLGLLAVLFPRATFIHCRRDLRDTALSCWMTHFRHIRWSNDLEHIDSRIQAYERIMDHWRQVLPVRWLDVQYEESVADLEPAARRLVAWCGLDWEPVCLEFHKERRTVRSASVAQVRRPLYGHAVGRWKNYKSVLTPLLAEPARA